MSTATTVSSSLTVQSNAELCVYGFVRQYCIDCEMPDELIQLCLVMLFIPIDIWSAEFDKNENYKLNADSSIATKKAGSWSPIFGTFIVKKGDIQTWKLKRNVTTKMFDVDGVVGIIDIDSRVESHGYFGTGPYDSYGLSFSSGNKVSRESFKKYAKKRVGVDQTLITMVLDMTITDNKKFGVLSFKLNDEDLGVAYDDIDIEKKFCLAMSLIWDEDGYEIVE